MEKEEERKREWKDFSIGESGKRNFQVPEGYFDQFPDRIIQRWRRDENKPQVKAIDWRRMVAAAAVVTGICIGITLLTNQPASTAETPEINSADAYQYILEHIDDFAPLILEPGQQAEATEHTAPETSSREVPGSSEIEEYLLEEMESEDFETLF